MPTPGQDGWLEVALAHRPTHEGMVLDSTRIAYRSWGDIDAPLVVLVHGGGAHSGWWDHVAPFLARESPVVGLDLSGHGDSDHRRTYSIDAWAREVLALCELRSRGPVVLVGHSMGGHVVLRAAVEALASGRQQVGVVTIDSPAAAINGRPAPHLTRATTGVPRGSASAAELRRRFTPQPDDGDYVEAIVDHVAAASMLTRDGRWFWKLDRTMFQHERVDWDRFAFPRCPTAVILPERGLLTPTFEALRPRLAPGTRVLRIAGAGHHAMLDQPVELIKALEMLVRFVRDRVSETAVAR
jgi:pimeloyl-ACP methyl ester carboxylesterase